MKKITLFMSEIDIDADLTILGQLGIMHIKPFQPAEDESIDRVNARIKQMKVAISILERYDNNPLTGHECDAEPKFSHMPKGEISLMEQVLQTEETRNQNIELAQKLQNTKHWYNDWGNVSLTEFKYLKEKGIYLKLYLLKDDAVQKLSNRDDIVVVGKLDKMNRIVLITENRNEKLESNEVEFPTYSLTILEDCIKKTNREIEVADEKLRTLHVQISFLRDALNERVRRNLVRNVQYGGIEVENQFRYWKGYIPEQSIGKFINIAEEHNWGYLIQDPTQEELEEVPTLIHSPKWVERIRPVMSFMGLVPGYNEIDVSRIFLIFFTFFTGILVGDAGYGFVFLLVTLFVHSKQKFKPKIEFSLIYTLSVSVLFWGVLTGTYFGAKQIAEIPFFSSLIIDKLSSFGGDPIFIQKLMFIIGAIHLSIGHIQKSLKYINSVKAIAELGWIAIIWSLYFIVNQMVLGLEPPELVIWLFIGGGLLIALFSNPGTNFFKGVISSLGGLPLSLISGFSDIISYIRLYAVGIATVLMAISFNQMAIGDGITTVSSGIVAVIILILGHGLNMILAAMAVIVHGVRLNMLEYAGHAGVEFSGNEFNPFTLKKSNNN
ncbi:MAG: hypothetical protein KKG99_09015 [Bacteroidetes bacterium]|nr:hypothetical protein [Bacteroidota bacterium]